MQSPPNCEFIPISPGVCDDQSPFGSLMVPNSELMLVADLLGQFGIISSHEIIISFG